MGDVGQRAGKEISEEEGGKGLIPSSTMLRLRFVAVAETVWASSSNCS